MHVDIFTLFKCFSELHKLPQYAECLIKSDVPNIKQNVIKNVVNPATIN